MIRLRVAARGSRLSLAQVAEAMEGLSEFLGKHVEWDVITVKSSGDVWSDKPLDKIGVVGAFTREVDEAVANGRADVAVHSFKDMPARGYDGALKIVYIAPRPSPRDALLTRDGTDATSIHSLSPGSVLGTSSARRRALALLYNPSLRITSLRGNLDTRLRKLEKGEYDAILASEAGLIRLGIRERYSPLDPRTFPPAPGQGFIAVVAARGSLLDKALEGADRPPWWSVALAEKSVIEGMEAGCRTPVGAYAELVGRSTVRITAVALAPDGSRAAWARVESPVEDARTAGVRLGRELASLGWVR